MSLELQNVRKSYREPGGGVVPVLNIAEFKLGAGEQIALIGESGGGKTTLLNIIAGLTAAINHAANIKLPHCKPRQSDPDAWSVRVTGVEGAHFFAARRSSHAARMPAGSSLKASRQPVQQT